MPCRAVYYYLYTRRQALEQTFFSLLAKETLRRAMYTRIWSGARLRM